MIDSTKPAKSVKPKPLPAPAGRAPYLKPRPTNLGGKIDPARPETDPGQHSLVAHEFESEHEIDKIFRENPTSKVIIGPTYMVSRDDWQKHKK